MTTTGDTLPSASGRSTKRQRYCASLRPDEPRDGVVRVRVGDPRRSPSVPPLDLLRSRITVACGIRLPVEDRSGTAPVIVTSSPAAHRAVAPRRC